MRRRHETKPLLAAMQSAAGPGPNRTIVGVKKVSSMAMFAATETILRRSGLVAIASAASASQPSGSGAWNASTIAPARVSGRATWAREREMGGGGGSGVGVGAAVV